MSIISNVPLGMRYEPGDSSEPVSIRAVNVISIHGSIYNRFVKKNCIEAFMSYEKVREVCSLDDIAMNYLLSQRINAFFDDWLVRSPDFEYKYFDDYFHTALSDADRAEYRRICDFNAKQGHVVDLVESYLTPKAYAVKHGYDGSDNGQCSIGCSSVEGGVGADLYRVVVYQSSIYIVVEEGFLESMEDKTSKLKFISDVLKAAYSIMPINTVNKSQWYSIYLRALQAVSV